MTKRNEIFIPAEERKSLAKLPFAILNLLPGFDSQPISEEIINSVEQILAVENQEGRRKLKEAHKKWLDEEAKLNDSSKEDDLIEKNSYKPTSTTFLDYAKFNETSYDDSINDDRIVSFVKAAVQNDQVKFELRKKSLSELEAGILVEVIASKALELRDLKTLKFLAANGLDIANYPYITALFDEDNAQFGSFDIVIDSEFCDPKNIPFELIKFLIDQGVKEHLDEDECTPVLSAFIESGNEDLAILFLPIVEDINGGLRRIDTSGEVETIKLYQTYLEQAIECNMFSLAKELVKKGAMVENTFCSGGPIFDYAHARGADMELLELLVQHGASIEGLSWMKYNWHDTHFIISGHDVARCLVHLGKLDKPAEDASMEALELYNTIQIEMPFYEAIKAKLPKLVQQIKTQNGNILPWNKLEGVIKYCLGGYKLKEEYKALEDTKYVDSLVKTADTAIVPLIKQYMTVNLFTSMHVCKYTPDIGLPEEVHYAIGEFLVGQTEIDIKKELATELAGTAESPDVAKEG